MRVIGKTFCLPRGRSYEVVECVKPKITKSIHASKPIEVDNHCVQDCIEIIEIIEIDVEVCDYKNQICEQSLLGMYSILHDI